MKILVMLVGMAPTWGCSRVTEIAAGDRPTDPVETVFSTSTATFTPEPRDSHPPPGESRPVYGYTFHRVDGNRWVDGIGNFPEVTAVDISLEGVPAWLVAVPFDAGSAWVAILEDGSVVGYAIDSKGVRPIEIQPEKLPPGMPPVLKRQGTRLELLVTPDDESSVLSHGIERQAGSSFLAYLQNDGDLVLLGRDSEKAVLELDAMIDGRILQSVDRSDISRLLVFVNPTERYDHGVLGDKVEAAGFAIVETSLQPPIWERYSIDPPAVIEGIAPIWTDITGDEVPEIIVTQSDSQQGSSIAVYDEDGHLQAVGPAIGFGYRWRHPIAVAPFGPAGELELAVIRTPHIGGVVEFYRVVKDELRIVAELPGFSSHSIGSRNLDAGLAGDFDGDGRIELLVPDQAHTALHAIRRQGNTAVAAWSLPLPGEYTTNLAAIILEDGQIGLGIGTASGVLRIWVP